MVSSKLRRVVNFLPHLNPDSERTLSRSDRFPINLGLAQDPERADSGSKTDRFRIQNGLIQDSSRTEPRFQLTHVESKSKNKNRH